MTSAERRSSSRKRPIHPTNGADPREERISELERLVAELRVNSLTAAAGRSSASSNSPTLRSSQPRRFDFARRPFRSSPLVPSAK
jgi:hypothetical protein